MLERRATDRPGAPSPPGSAPAAAAPRTPVRGAAAPRTAVVGSDDDQGTALDGRYRLGDVVGRGGMATVHRAHDLVLRRDVAVKVFSAVDEADDLSRHAAETQVLAALNHPNLVTLYDAGSLPAPPGRQAYLVMELVDGPTLAERLADGPLSVEETLVVAHQLADALSAVHDAQVVHRDIKPANVLLTSPTSLHDRDPRTAPVVKLADFGIARLAGMTRLTMTGVTIGTMRYLSPEQAAGGPVGPPTDVYALGLVLIECLTGEPAFAGTAAEAAAVRLTRGPHVPPQSGEVLGPLLARMTATDPDERPTAGEVAELTAPGRPVVQPMTADRADATAVLPLGTGTRPVPTAPDAAHPHTRRWLAGAGALLLAAGAVVVGLRASGDGTQEPTAPPSYPTVEGDLGTALTSLQRSVTP
ncbi:serine/threonine-protein kinase [Cellulomonas sp.]|uniref:serine/threonine-protein kinase n=1 Tax=Cellulomonas sp. TaxID=40001 RepID=UPI001B14404C|nr:serine/threonine-protein kinase [Cellulomonas sp.]MBO9554440.1 serine/threonine protein kinase [Cellulomonas sp.]